MAATPTGGDTPVSPNTLSGTLAIDALLSDNRWGTGITQIPTVLTYSFPSGSPAYKPGYYPYATGQWAAFTPTLEAYTRQALQAWADVANISLVEVDDGPDAVGDLRFAQVTYDIGTAAMAFTPRGDYPEAGDVWIHAEPSTANPVPGGFAYWLLLHEIGHALGLKHPTDTQAGTLTNLPVMPQVSSLQSVMAGNNSLLVGSPLTPMLYDVQAIQYLYGPNMAYRTGNDVYTFSPNQLLTIWDAGGTDTISGSGLIDLRQGAISEVSGAKIAIAFSTIIENATGGDNADVLTGNDAVNTLVGGAGDDTLAGGLGDDLIAGGAGTDTVKFSGVASSYTTSVGVNGFVTVTGPEGTDLMTEVEFIRFGDGAPVALTSGLDGDNVIVGDAEANVLRGGFGSDMIFGGPGNDWIEGDSNANPVATGNDVLLGEAGDDIIFGGPGNDVVAAGPGSDTVVGEDGDDALNGEGGNDAIAGGPGDDTLLGWDDQDILFGGTGGDLMYGGNGNDIMMGNEGDPNDLADGVDIMLGDAGSDTMHGGAGNDGINGGDGNDVIDGSNGNDVIVGGPGSDIMLGSNADALGIVTTGNDLFVYSSMNEAGDSIYGFDTRMDDRDIVYVVPLFDALGITGNSLASLGASGHLRVLNVPGGSVVQVDTNGGGDSYAALVSLVGVNAAAVTDANFLFQ